MRRDFSWVWTLIFANVIVFLVEMNVGGQVIDPLALWPLGSGFMPWQVLTYAFLHGSITHIAFNMYGLWMFGRELEYLMGPRRFLQLYFASVVSGALVQLLVAGATGSVYPILGASGGVFGLLLAYAIYFPRRVIMLIVPPIPLPAWLFATLYAILELTLGVTGTQAEVAHFAHLGGMIGAYLALRYTRRRRR